MTVTVGRLTGRTVGCPAISRPDGHVHLMHDPGKGERSWDPQAPPRRADFDYLGRMLVEFGRRLPDPPLTVVVSTEHRRPLRRGRDVVVVQRAGPDGFVPPYADDVLALFKTHSPRPVLAARPGREPVALSLVTTLAFAQVLARAAPSHLARAARRLRRGPRGALDVLPMGCIWPGEVCRTPVGERPVDLLFNGSVETGQRRGLRRWVGTPKGRSRRAMLEAARTLPADVAVELAVTGSFADSKHADPAEYAARLARAKLCLAPRGDTLETYRVFEAARAGCVVLGEHLPASWFTREAPVVDLTGWRDLRPRVLELLADEAALAELQRRTLAWWDEVAGPEAAGRRMADVVRAALAAGR